MCIEKDNSRDLKNSYIFACVFHALYSPSSTASLSIFVCTHTDANVIDVCLINSGLFALIRMLML